LSEKYDNSTGAEDTLLVVAVDEASELAVMVFELVL